MRIAFYAPLKPPTHGVPSGDRRVAGLLMEALQRGGHRVELVSSFRSFDGSGDAARQLALRNQGLELQQRLVRAWQGTDAAARPDLWFTYHLYHKAPDWLGPGASTALGIPYVLAEASHAPKRARGPWALGHEAAAAAIQRADLVLSPTRHDMVCLAPLLGEGERLQQLPPFLDAEPFRDAIAERGKRRAQLADSHGLDASQPWLVAVAMMRKGDKLASYRQLAEALAHLADLAWQLVVIGDGPEREAVGAVLDAAAPGRSLFLGELALAEVAAVSAACDLCLWPAVNEAYGMAMLEAQAAGIPVISCNLRGVPDILLEGRSGLLAPTNDMAILARLARRLLLDPHERAAMGRAAAEWVARERGLDAATARLNAALSPLITNPQPS